MSLAVYSAKPCWPSATSDSGYATDGGFPFQMQAVSELFDETTLVVPCSASSDRAGEIGLGGKDLMVAPITEPWSSGIWRKILFPVWLSRNSLVVLRHILK